MITAAIIVLAYSQGKSIDGEAAKARVRTFARQAGYRDKFEVVNVAQVDGKRWGEGAVTLWTIGLRAASGGWISANVRPDGAISYFCVGGFQHKPLKVVDAERVAWDLIKAIPHREQLEIDSIGSGESGAGAQFFLLVNGKRFFNLNPTYGYYITFDPSARQITWFGRQDLPPAVNAKREKISSAAAKSEFLRYAMNPGQYDSVIGLLSPKWPTPMDLTPQLGYYLRKQESKARLVYRGIVSPHGVKAKGARSYLKVFIDALTGERIVPDDQL
ncbi:hypothetical protein [Fimbriimonas ginsengisoli]|uniref:Uncharacterized protein n=1 Tax=Fimbriimonas ginsengisoli Gsoil 348 TaxID=661478 RepID=A0A068NRI8_FIMGI|nr:hypothetical protein [Fimbriimonas ginsengisoli]AIE84219.1 hypothetical protein OP10G_0851 [Fimbriimonas ginsengisoli Gsoil 348]